MQRLTLSWVMLAAWMGLLPASVAQGQGVSLLPNCRDVGEGGLLLGVIVVAGIAGFRLISRRS